jgi:hypothetical protein
VKFREFLFESAEEIRVVGEGKFGVESTDDVKFRSAFSDRRASDIDTFFDRMSVRVLLSSSSIESAELAVGDADIRMVEVTIDVEVGGLTVLCPSDMVCKFAEGVQVSCFEEIHSFFERNSVTREYLFRDSIQLVVE